MQTLAVYCGSNSGQDPAFTQQAHALADAMARQAIDLVYGGSRNGLMAAIADRMLDQQGHVIGVIPARFVDWERAHTRLSQLITVQTMTERKQVMYDRADGFIALPGGIGTLEEIIEMLSWAQLGLHHKPCAFLNVNGYYDKLIEFFDHSLEQGLMRQHSRDMILLDDDPERLISRMQAYESPVSYRWD